MSKRNDAIKRVKCSIDSIEDINKARAILAEGPLTKESYEKLNVDGAMDSLLGTMVFSSDLADVDRCSSLRIEMNEKLCQAFIDNSKALRAALEDYTSNILEVLQSYDAHHEQDAGVRARISEFEARLDDAAKEKLAAVVMEYECFSLSNALAICEELCNVADFIENNCDNDILTAVSEVAGADMSDDQKFYLSSLKEKLSETLFVKNDIFDVANRDRTSGLTFEQLGFCAKGLNKVAKALNKAEGKFIKAARTLRETVVRDTSTDEAVTKKNAMFYDVMDMLCHFVGDGAMCRNYLSEQVNLMAHQLSLVAAGVAQPSEEETQEDEDANKNPGEEGNKASALERGDDVSEEAGDEPPADPSSNEPGEQPVEQAEK
jgi:hypothetical protein